MRTKRLFVTAMLIMLSVHAHADSQTTTSVLSLDGDNWLLASDPKNEGRQEEWFRGPRPEAKKAKVPFVIQDTFPGYHGVAWYWREFSVPIAIPAEGRCLLRFWAVDYKADVWVNSVPVGGHEGGEDPFELDVTHAIKPGQANRLAVRVLNPTYERIDGIVLDEVPARGRGLPFQPGGTWNVGGIMDSVELVVVPAVRAEELYAKPDWKTGAIHISATYHNATTKRIPTSIEFSVAPTNGSEAVALQRLDREFPPGDMVVESKLIVPYHRLWELDEPNLYRVTSRTTTAQPVGHDDRSVRCGFRDFRFEGGSFRLNGKRIYLRGAHTGNAVPIGLEIASSDPDLLRRDLINAKAMRLNMVRFLGTMPRRYQLDLCDEIGILVYEESYASGYPKVTSRFAEQFDHSTLSMVRRDRNHPSVVVWGLLNEREDGTVFRYAMEMLPKLRAGDDTRVVILNSGRFDHLSNNLAGMQHWGNADHNEPSVDRNPSAQTVKATGSTWAPGRLSLHPGAAGEYAVVRWQAPAAGQAEVNAVFASIAEKATTNACVRHNGQVIFAGDVNCRNAGPQTQFKGTVAIEKGDTIDCTLGFGDGTYFGDTTGLVFTVRLGNTLFDAAKEFSVGKNPTGPWSYGQMAPGEKPDVGTFARFAVARTTPAVGSLSNPGSNAWENSLGDAHVYPRVPLTAEDIQGLRVRSGNGAWCRGGIKLGDTDLPTFYSEGGIGSAYDYDRIPRLYEQHNRSGSEEAVLACNWRSQFMDDYNRHRMDEVFPRPADFFRASGERMARERLRFINAVRANPKVVGYSMSSLVDGGMAGEGLWTLFRELKPGTGDVLFDGLAPLRWCNFVEPVNVYRKSAVRLEAVLANEDVLQPGKYLVRLLVVGPKANRVFDKRIEVTIRDTAGASDLPMVMPIFDETVLIDGPSGKYRFLVAFEQGAAAAGGETEFYVADPAELPTVDSEVVVWGEDPQVVEWLSQGGIKHRPFDAKATASREAILAVGTPGPNAKLAFRELAEHMASGATVIFLSPNTLARDNAATGWIPLIQKGSYGPSENWLYHKDEWSKDHSIFDGLPSRGLMDYTFYRELIPDNVFYCEKTPDEAIAAATQVARCYSFGVLVGAYRFNEGRFLLNSLLIRENLGSNPVADRLLRNMLRWAAADTNKPLAPLPADFETQLDSLGY